jgi:hypothetical protein
MRARSGADVADSFAMLARTMATVCRRGASRSAFAFAFAFALPALALAGCSGAPQGSAAGVSGASVEPEVTEPGCASGSNACGATGMPASVPRATAPPPGATVDSTQPILRWDLAPGSSGAQVDICLDRACASLVTRFAAVGASGAPPAAIAGGTYFWRLHAVAGSAVDPAASAAWELVIAPHA